VKKVISESHQAKVKMRSMLFIFTFAFCFFPILFSACGKRRPPLPPTESVPQRTEALSGAQRGNQVILSWPAPLRNAPESSVQSIRRIDIYRLAERPTDPLPLTEEQFAARATLIGSISFEQIQQAGPTTLTYIDNLALSGEPARLRYALRYANASGQRAAFSNFLLIEPAARISEPPVIISGKQESENAIHINWRPPTANIDGSVPVNLLGYNVYRYDQSQAEPGQTPINNALINGTQFIDQNIRAGEQYNYIVRSVSLGTGGAQVESLNSNIVSVGPKDIFPPTAPTGISIAAAPSRISLFFPSNPERDVVGYNLYRSTDPNLPKADWTKLNNQLLTRTTYQDDAVESGKKYYYYLTAVDTAGNVSQPSEVVSETVP
jgi:hypothetical protein